MDAGDAGGTVVLIGGDAGALGTDAAATGAAFTLRRVADVEEAEAAPPGRGVFVVGPGVPSPLAAARRLRRRWPAAQLVFLCGPAALERLRTALPFVPELSDAWTASSDAPAESLRLLLAEALRTARRRAGSALLAQRLNTMLDTGGVRTERAERDRRISLSERYLGLIAAQSRTPVLALDRDGVLLALNEAAEALFGAPAPGTVCLPDRLPPADADRLRAAIARVAEVGAEAQTALSLPGPAGGTVELDVSLAPLEIGDGAARAVSCVARDVTEQRRTQAALRRSEQAFQDLAETLPGFVWTAGPDGRPDYQSRQWHDYSGTPPGSTLGDRWVAHLHPDDVDAAQRAWDTAVATGEDYRAELRLRGSDGAYRWFLARARPVHGTAETAPRWVGTCTEIGELVEARTALARTNDRLEELVARRTAQLEDANRKLLAEVEERRQTEAVLHQAQKMEAIGRLTGGVAHDFNNLLQVVGGNLQLVLPGLGDPAAQRRVQSALAAVERGGKLASQLLAFARRQPLEPTVIDVARLLRGMDDLLRRSLGEAIELETVIAGGLWTTLADPNQLENVVLNLAVNARDAMDGAGRLTFEAGNAMLDDLYAATHSEVTPGQYVMLAVTDTGCGIPPEMLERVFEPFFTTKPEGKGTGLGLPMVHGFVKQSGGHVKIYSEVGHGTTVKIYLPRAHQAAAEPPADVRAGAGAVVGGSETVLVVEDDPQVRATAVEILADLGYRILQAPDAQSALAVVRSGAAIDLLFTDVVMPGPLRSPELARRAREVLPDLAVLFTSGYTENAIVHGGRLDPGVQLLSKPYRREDLARKIRQVLANRRPRTAVADDAREPCAPAAAGRRVLLVEDEVLIRLTTVDMLKALGHTVTAVADAEAALRALAGAPFDVLFTDVGLPGRSGLELVREALPTAPGLRVIIATGYAGDIRLGHGEADLDAVLLPKPYTLSDIDRAFRTLGGG
ncbi:response regulator [Azospirillum sp. ST 5-10]|uniref:response regulator n=1 Tax=unclassified Azospirillum TaxID=2630922 RepID=UPI003F49E1CC